MDFCGAFSELVIFLFLLTPIWKLNNVWVASSVLPFPDDDAWVDDDLEAGEDVRESVPRSVSDGKRGSSSVLEGEGGSSSVLEGDGESSRSSFIGASS